MCAGSNPTAAVAPFAVAVMREADIDIAAAKPKGFNGLPALNFDYLVTMGCEVGRPFLPGVRQMQWQIPDPHGKGIAEYRRVREIIRERVRGLLASLDLLKQG